MNDRAPQPGAALAAAVRVVLEPSFAALEDLAAQTVVLLPEWAGTGPTAAVPERVFASLDKTITPHLTSVPELVGLGFVAAPALVAGQRRFLYWWQRSDDHLARLHLNFDPESIDVYDYLQMEWFQSAQGGAPRSAFGPYVDYTGAGLYVVTVSVPVVRGGVFLGVAGGDVEMAALEPRLLDVLLDCPVAGAVLTAERRVVAATHPDWVVGSRLAEGGELPATTPVPHGAGWQVLTLPQDS
ncbi:MAG: hypothetical protein WAW88_03150 [Nocardioides sp.]